MNKIYLDRNENNYGPAPKCLQVLNKFDLTQLSIYSKAYEKGVKSILSERLAREFKISERRVILGYGAEDILKQAVQCYLGKDEKLMIPAYSWWYYKEIANEVEGINIEYPLIKGKESFYYDIEHMLHVIEIENPKLIFISSPNNPTGNSLAFNDLNTILEKINQTIVVLDQAYWYSNNNENVIKLINRFPNLLVIRTFSKYYALAGIRIGYGVIGKNLTKLAKLSNRYLGYNGISEEIAMAALDSPDYYDDITAKLDQDKHRYYDQLGQIPGWRVFKSDGNFILVEIPKEQKEPLQKYLISKGLIIKFMNEELLNSHLRITMGTQEQNRILLEAIHAFFSK